LPAWEENEEEGRVASKYVVSYDREKDNHRRGSDPIRGSRERNHFWLHQLCSVEPHHWAQGQTEDSHKEKQAHDYKFVADLGGAFVDVKADCDHGTGTTLAKSSNFEDGLASKTC